MYNLSHNETGMMWLNLSFDMQQGSLTNYNYITYIPLYKNKAFLYDKTKASIASRVGNILHLQQILLHRLAFDPETLIAVFTERYSQKTLFPCSHAGIRDDFENPFCSFGRIALLFPVFGLERLKICFKDCSGICFVHSRSWRDVCRKKLCAEISWLDQEYSDTEGR